MSHRFHPLARILAVSCALSAPGRAEMKPADEVTPVPDALRARFDLAPFYQKALDLDGLPILGSGQVSDHALREAAWIVRKMLTAHPEILGTLEKNGVRVVIMAHNEYTTDVPEQSDWDRKDFWDKRARGMGGQISSGGEENLLCFPGDPYSTENILIHEFAHTIHDYGLKKLIPDFDEQVTRAYDKAIGAGLWKDTYASENAHEYWAEGVQSWFDNNRENDAIHNSVDTRAELKEYDPDLAALCEQVFGDGPWRYRKPMERPAAERAHLAGYDPSKAPMFRWRDGTPANPKPSRAFHSDGNPILGDGTYFSADAAPLSDKGKLYIYAGHDEPAEEVGGFVMFDYGVFVTDDPESGEWSLYQNNLDPDEVFDWATGNSAYAGQVAKGPDGRFYWYVPVESKNTEVPNRMAIGVAVSDGPLGPWKDPIGKPLVSWADVFGDAKVGQEIIDPHVFTDDDGTIYLYWGSWGVARVVKLEKSMTALDGDITTMSGLDWFFEAPWVFKRDGTYYLAYDWKQGGSKWTPSNYQAAIGYATSSSPTGPWTFQGVILSGTSATTVHPSIVEHGDRWWITYHTRDAKTGGHFRRSVAIDEVRWDGDRILPVEPTFADPPALRLTNNLAVDAKASASFTEQPPMTLRALNDGRPPVVRLPPDQWGNYRGNDSKTESDWIQYDWEVPVRIAGVGIEFHQDPNWIRPPAEWKVESLDARGAWREVKGARYPTEPDKWLTVKFDPVTSKALRATFKGRKEGAHYHSVSVSEWEVYSEPAAKLPVGRISTKAGKAPELPTTARLSFGKAGTLPVPVRWPAVDPECYSKPGSFKIEGRAAGQAAGHVIAEITVTR